MYQADETEATSPPLPKDRAEAVMARARAAAAVVKVNTDIVNDTNHPGKSGRPMRNFGDLL